MDKKLIVYAGIGGAVLLAAFYLYKKKAASQSSGYSIGAPVLPAGLAHIDSEELPADWLPAPRTPNAPYVPPQITLDLTGINYPTTSPYTNLPTTVSPTQNIDIVYTPPPALVETPDQPSGPSSFTFVSGSVQAAPNGYMGFGATSTDTIPTQLTTITDDGYVIIQNLQKPPGYTEPFVTSTTISRLN